MPHISFSELKAWDTCAYYHKLTYIDKVRLFIGNEFTAFGKALHSACEHNADCIKDGKTPKDLSNLFKEEFLNELLELKNNDCELDKKLISQMKEQGAILAPLAFPALEDYFEEFEIIKAEERLYESILEYEGTKFKFKGFIDLIVKTPDGKYHIIDWKTCGWGWDARKRSEPMVTYQLTLYKKYFCQKHNIDPRMVDTHFALLKRTAKTELVELFRVTSGPKKTQNALNLMKKALYSIDNKISIKNRLACSKCEFHNTEHCT